MGLLDEVLGGSPAPTRAKSKSLLDEVLGQPSAPKPAAGGSLLDEVLGSDSAPGAIPEGKRFDVRGMQFQMKGGELVEQTPQRRKFFEQRPEMLKDAPQQFELPANVDLSGLSKGRMETGQDAAKAEGLSRPGFVKNDATYNPTSQEFLSNVSQRFITPVAQTVRDFEQRPEEGLKDINAPNILNPDDLRELGAPQGEGKYATFREFSGLQPRAPGAQGNVMDAPRTHAERVNREILSGAAEMLNPVDPMNLIMEIGVGGAGGVSKVGKGIGEALDLGKALAGGGEDLGAAFARGLDEGATDLARTAPHPAPEPIGYEPVPARPVPRDVSAGPLDNLATAARGQFENLLPKRDLAPPAPVLEQSVNDLAPDHPLLNPAEAPVPGPVAAMDRARQMDLSGIPEMNPELATAKPAGAIEDALPSVTTTTTENGSKLVGEPAPGGSLLDEVLGNTPETAPKPLAEGAPVPEPAPPASLLDEVLGPEPAAPEVAVPGKKAEPLRLSAFGAAELQKMDRFTVDLHSALQNLGKGVVKKLAEHPATNRLLRSYRFWTRPGGNAPEAVIKMTQEMEDRLAADHQAVLDEIVPMLQGDQRRGVITRLDPGGKWTSLEQEAVGHLIKGADPADLANVPAGGVEAARKASRLMSENGLDLLSQTLAVDRQIIGTMEGAEVEELGGLIRGHIPLSQASTDRMQALAEKSIRDLEKMGALEPATDGVRAIKDSMLHERTFFRNYGRYMPRLYNKFEWDKLAQDTLEELAQQAPADMQGELRQTLVQAMQPVASVNRGVHNQMAHIVRDRFLRRKDLPPELRRALGEILSPAFPIAKGHYQLRQAIEQQKLFRGLASNPDWVAPRGTIGLYDHATERPWVLMKQDPEFGVLSDRLVHPDIAEHLEHVKLARSYGEKSLDKAVQAWKFGKVVLNPASHVRNFLSNVIMTDLAGMGVGPGAAKRHMQAVADYIAQGEWYKLAREHNVLGGSWHEGEVKALAEGLLGPVAAGKDSTSLVGQLARFSQIGVRTPGVMMQAGDQVFKMSLFRWAAEKQGMSLEDAAKFVADTMPDYRQNGRIVQLAAGKNIGKFRVPLSKISSKLKDAEISLDTPAKMFSSPFINFSANTLPKVFKSALGIGIKKGEMRAFDPMVALRFWKYPLMIAGWNTYAANQLGMTDEEVENSKPDYMRTSIPGSYMLMPFRDEHGRMLHADLGYILPWGDFTKMRFNQDDPHPPPILSVGGPVQPLVDVLYSNRDTFTGKDIVSAGMPPEVALARRIDYIYRSWMPALAPGIPGLTGSHVGVPDAQEAEYTLARSGGSSSSKMFSAIFRIPDYKGRQRAMGTTLADVFLGIKLQPVDEAATMRSKAFERTQVIRSINEDIKRVRKDQGWAQTPEVQQSYIRRLNEQKANILRGGQVRQSPMFSDLWRSIIEPEHGMDPVPTGPQG